MKWLLELFLGKGYTERKKYKLPKKIDRHWYNGRVHGLTESGRFFPIVFDEKGKYIDCKIGNVHCVGETKDGNKIFYKVVDMHFKSGGDWLYSSDSIHCDLQFSHVELIKKRHEEL